MLPGYSILLDRLFHLGGFPMFWIQVILGDNGTHVGQSAEADDVEVHSISLFRLTLEIPYHRLAGCVFLHQLDGEVESMELFDTF